MSLDNFIKQNFVLVVGLALPALLIFFFLLSTIIPQSLSDPPKYDMLFWTDESRAEQLPIGVNFVVKEGVLTAQYTKYTQPGYYAWKKLYHFDAKTGKVREIPFGLPTDMDTITGVREEPVKETQQLHLDTMLQSPDGYELSYDGYSHSGLLNDILWNDGYSNEVRLRKGASSVKLMGSDASYFYYGNVHLIGWVIP